VKIAITGASGLIGRKLLKTFAAEGHTLYALSRHAGTNMPAGVRLAVWDAGQGEPPEEALREADAVIHLAGESVAQRWTADARQRILESRQGGTRSLVRALAKLGRRPEVLICASAVGYYGSRGDETLTESCGPGIGFLPNICVAWEREAQAAEALGMRVVRMRIGVALDTRGGALKSMLGSFRIGAGGRLGDGRQWMSWIHMDDLAALIGFVLANRIAGPVNAVAPQPVTNAEFTRELGRVLHRPALLPVPRLVLRLLLGEMSEILLASQRAIPQAAQAAGFEFQFPELGAALANLLK
jgi:uncharacterized protein (TIGR01777 family)